MLDNLVPDLGKILKADTEWIIEFMVNNPTEDLYFTYLSCSRDSTDAQAQPQKPQAELLVFNHYPSGYDFIKNIAERRGKVEITAGAICLIWTGMSHFLRSYRLFSGFF